MSKYGFHILIYIHILNIESIVLTIVVSTSLIYTQTIGRTVLQYYSIMCSFIYVCYSR